MKRLMIVLAFIVAALALASAQGGSVEQSIKAMTEQLNQAALKGDIATYDKLLADDYISIGILGGTSSKAELLENFKSGKLKFEAIDVSDMKVRVYGDAALAISTANVKGHLGATDISGQYRSVRVWVKRKGQWQSVSFQATRIAQMAAGSRETNQSPSGYCHYVCPTCMEYCELTILHSGKHHCRKGHEWW